MAKKTATAVSGADPKSETPKPEVKAEHATPVVAEAPEFNLSRAIREGLQALPDSQDSSNRDALQALKKWLKDKFPANAEAFDSDTFGSTLSGQRKKLKGDGGEAKTTAAPKSNGASDDTPTLDDVDRAKAMVEGLEINADDLMKLASDIHEFGSLVKLKKCLEKLKGWGLVK